MSRLPRFELLWGCSDVLVAYKFASLNICAIHCGRHESSEDNLKRGVIYWLLMVICTHNSMIILYAQNPFVFYLQSFLKICIYFQNETLGGERNDTQRADALSEFRNLIGIWRHPLSVCLTPLCSWPPLSPVPMVTPRLPKVFDMVRLQSCGRNCMGLLVSISVLKSLGMGCD